MRLRLNSHFVFRVRACVLHLHFRSAFACCICILHLLSRVAFAPVRSYLALTFPIRLSLLYCPHVQDAFASRLHVARSDAFSRACPVMATRRACGV